MARPLYCFTYYLFLVSNLFHFNLLPRRSSRLQDPGEGTGVLTSCDAVMTPPGKPRDMPQKHLIRCLRSGSPSRSFCFVACVTSSLRVIENPYRQQGQAFSYIIIKTLTPILPWSTGLFPLNATECHPTALSTSACRLFFARRSSGVCTLVFRVPPRPSRPPPRAGSSGKSKSDSVDRSGRSGKNEPYGKIKRKGTTAARPFYF